MKKFFNNLAVWWGWIAYKRTILFYFTCALLPIILFALQYFWLVIRKLRTDAMFIESKWWVFCFIVMIAAMLLGSFFEKMHRNWRVAVDMAKKMAEDPNYEALQHRTLWVYAARAEKEKSGKELAKLIQLLQRYDELSARIESFEEERDKLDVEHDKVIDERISVSEQLKRDYSS